MRILTAIVLTASLAATATAQGPDRAARDARFTCQLLEGILLPLLDSADPAYVSPFFMTNPPAGPHRVETFSDFVNLHAGAGLWGSPEWQTAFGQLPLSMVADAWTVWNAGGPVSCPELSGIRWTTPSEFAEMSRHAEAVNAAVRAMGPLRPGVDSPVEITHPRYLAFSRPVFDEFGYRALVIQDYGFSTTIYEFRDGHWQAQAFDIRIVH